MEQYRRLLLFEWDSDQAESLKQTQAAVQSAFPFGPHDWAESMVPEKFEQGKGTMWYPSKN